jgi:hypothetical protein
MIYLVFFIGLDLLDLLLSAHENDKTSKFIDEELFQEALTFDEILFNIFLKISFSKFSSHSS